MSFTFLNTCLKTEKSLPQMPMVLDYIASLIQNKNYPSYTFSLQDDETTNLTDQEFLKVLASGQHHCQIGDVFQIVLSRRFSESLPEMNLMYTGPCGLLILPLTCFILILAAIKIFGSSPEAQITIQNGKPVFIP
jgi:anthranilate synthase component 1